MLVQKNKILSNFGGPFENLSVNAVPILKYTKIIGNITKYLGVRNIGKQTHTITKISKYIVSLLH